MALVGAGELPAEVNIVDLADESDAGAPDSIQVEVLGPLGSCASSYAYLVD